MINAKLVSSSHVAVALDNWNPEDGEEAQDKFEEEHEDSAKLQEAQDKLKEEHEDEPPDSISTPSLDADQLLIPNKRVIADQNIQLCVYSTCHIYSLLKEVILIHSLSDFV